MNAAVRHFSAAIAPRRWALLALFGGVLLPLIAFGELAEDVWTREGFSWDAPILWWIHDHATPAADRAMLLITNCGGPLPMIGLTTILLGALLWRRRYADTAFVVLAIGGAAALNVLAKATFQRHRPTLWPQLTIEIDYGFPSGHAMGSLAVVAALAILLWPTRWRWPMVLLGGMFAALVGFSRAYLGVHYPSDVLAGWCASFAWVAGVYLLRAHLTA